MDKEMVTLEDINKVIEEVYLCTGDLLKITDRRGSNILYDESNPDERYLRNMYLEIRRLIMDAGRMYIDVTCKILYEGPAIQDNEGSYSHLIAENGGIRKTVDGGQSIEILEEDSNGQMNWRSGNIYYDPKGSDFYIEDRTTDGFNYIKGKTIRIRDVI